MQKINNPVAICQTIAEPIHKERRKNQRSGLTRNADSLTKYNDELLYPERDGYACADDDLCGADDGGGVHPCAFAGAFGAGEAV